MTDARALASRLADLLGREHAAMAEFLVALADFDRRKSWAELGYSSLFHFLHRELALSKGAAHYRKTAAELVQRFPEIVEPLRDGRLCITSIVHLAKVITPENRHQILPKFLHCSKREAMAVAAAEQPASAAPHRDVVTAVRMVPATLISEPAALLPVPETLLTAATTLLTGPNPPSPSASQLEVPVQPVELRVSPSEAAELRASAPTRAAPAALFQKRARCDSSEPLTAELSRLHVTVSKRFLDKLDAARSALSHSRPDASAEAILEAGLDLVLERHARRRGLVKKPRADKPRAKPADRSVAEPPDRPGAKSPDVSGAKCLPEPPAKCPPGSAANSPGLTAAVKRQVWTRDRGCCQWPLESGDICGSTLRVEFDHVVPRAAGGPSTADNVRLLCRVHNDRAARRAFGDDWMDQFTRNPAAAKTGAVRDGRARPAEHGPAPPIHGTG